MALGRRKWTSAPDAHRFFFGGGFFLFTVFLVVVVVVDDFDVCFVLFLWV